MFTTNEERYVRTENRADSRTIAGQSIQTGKSLGARAGSLGVRGLIEIDPIVSTELFLGGPSDTNQAAAFEHFIRSALTEFHEQRVRRIHLIVPADSPVGQVASTLGFSIPSGEFLHERNLPEGFSSAASLPFGYHLRNGTPADLVRLHGAITQSPELAFQGWEFPIIADNTQAHNRLFKVIECGRDIVGISIGGTFEKRGTISHLWVDRNHRNKDLGTALVEDSLQALSSAGADTIHLMTVAGNDGGRRFWARQQFTISERIFYEIDL